MSNALRVHPYRVRVTKPKRTSVGPIVSRPPPRMPVPPTQDAAPWQLELPPVPAFTGDLSAHPRSRGMESDLQRTVIGILGEVTPRGSSSNGVNEQNGSRRKDDMMRSIYEEVSS